MDVRLDGKVAIVTGAARGQGAAEAELLVESGASVVMTDVLDDAGRDLAERLGDMAVFVSHDVSSVGGWKIVVESAVDRFGGIDVLVNNAGILSRKGIEDMTIDEYRRLMSINLDGAVIGTKAVIPHMRARGGGSIINIGSVAGMSGSTDLAAYTVSKWALRGFTKCTALEFGPENIRANAVFPDRSKPRDEQRPRFKAVPVRSRQVGPSDPPGRSTRRGRPARLLFGLRPRRLRNGSRLRHRWRTYRGCSPQPDPTCRLVSAT